MDGRRLSRHTGRPFSFNLQQIASLGTHYREVIELAIEANRTGAQLRPQITPRGVGVLFSLAANSLIDDLPSFQPFKSADLEGRLAALRDPEVRGRLIAEGAGKAMEPFERMYLMPADQPARYDYAAATRSARSRGPRARRRSRRTSTRSIASDGRSLVNWPVMNEQTTPSENWSPRPSRSWVWPTPAPTPRRSWTPSQPTYFLAHWVRDRAGAHPRGGRPGRSPPTPRLRRLRGSWRVVPGASPTSTSSTSTGCRCPFPRSSTTFPVACPASCKRRSASITPSSTAGTSWSHGEHTGAPWRPSAAQHRLTCSHRRCPSWSFRGAKSRSMVALATPRPMRATASQGQESELRHGPRAVL